MSTQKKSPLTRESASIPPIAIIGMAGIFPKAEDLERYWANILEEVNCIAEVPPSRWQIEDYYDPNPEAVDKSYSKYGGFIPDILFDPMEFGLPPNILEVTDVSQLLGLVVARDVLADAGYPPKDKKIFDRTGVILGMVGMSSKVIQPLLNRLQYPIWEKVLRSSSVPEEEIPAIIEKMKLAYISWNENAFPGAIGNVVAGRIANRFDLGGTNCIVDAACGSSLAAVSMAINELALGRADMMITGGVDSDNSILTYLCFSKTPAFSKGDRVRAFSEDSDGMLVGEGMGMLVLKRLADAERDGDRIYAVIRGLGTSSDGYFKSIYAPRPSGQAKALRRAYESAGYPPYTVDLIEAHGTGTMAGDPAEFEGLREAFSEDCSNKPHIALGSVKSQIGHTKAAAGAASLIKVSLALHHKVLPPTINVSRPNPALKIEQSPFYLNTETRPWFKRLDGTPRRAGVSSFGFGGTNFHITMEEYNRSHDDQFYRLQTVPYTVLLFAPTPHALRDVCRAAVNELTGEHAQSVLNQLDQASYTQKVPLEHARIGIVAKSVEEAREKLAEAISLLDANQGQNAWSHPKGIFYRSSGLDPKGKTVALFPGQGSQYVNMGRELAINFPAFREIFERADALMMVEDHEPLTSLVFPIPVFSAEERKIQQEKLTMTENAQPAIGAVSMGLYALLRSAGFQADFFAGHSFGELTALWASGVLDDEAYLRLAIARGQAMSRSDATGKDCGSMVAVKGDIEKISQWMQSFPNVRIANFNSPSQVVLAGSTAEIQEVRLILEKEGMRVYPLDVSAAFHTQFVAHASAPFATAIKREKFNQPIGRVYSNTSAKPYPSDENSVVQMLTEHILNPVKFKDEIENIYADGGRIFIEFGPKNVLSNLVKDILAEAPHEVVTLNANIKGDSDMQFRQAVLQLRVLGFALGNIDPHRTYKEDKPAASKVAVMLNGGLYSTETTKQKFEQALKEKSDLKRRVPKAPEREGAAHVELSFASPAAYQPNESERNKEQSEASVMIYSSEIESLIAKLQNHQSNILDAHEQFLKNDGAVKDSLQEILHEEIGFIGARKENNGSQQQNERALLTIEKWAESIAKQHEATSNAHAAFIQSQMTFTQQCSELIQALMKGAKWENGSLPPQIQEKKRDAAPSASKPEVEAREVAEEEGEAVGASQPAPIEPSANDLSASFLSIVSEKTGYPADMLDLTMDMEADLGIDSIKRVEIFGAMQEQYPQLPSISAEELVELRTLGQVIDAFGGGENLPVSFPSEIHKDKEEPNKTAAEQSGSSVDVGEIQSVFLDVVSEKTGYPAEMLDTSMDMEADLGIDSIKRVEILGAMQEKYPHLPSISAEELVELRTLGQIIAKFNNGRQKEENTSTHAVVEARAEKNNDLSIFQTATRRLPKPDKAVFNIPQGSAVLITADDGEKARELAEVLAKEGLKIGLINLSKPSATTSAGQIEGCKRYVLEDASEAAVKNLMQKIVADYEKIFAFIHLEPNRGEKRTEPLEIKEDGENKLKAIFLMARDLKSPLMAVTAETRPAFITVTQMDGKFGLNGYEGADPLPGGFAGLVKTLRLEWPNVFCRALDFHPSLEPRFVAEKIKDELFDADLRLSEVGYTPEGRFTIVLEEEVKQ